MIKLLSIISIILAIVLFPPAALALVSNNAVPGERTYPIKRTLEDIIYSAASLNPTTKAWFSAARSDRRYKEFSILVTQGKFEKNTLSELVTQTNIAANQITQVSDTNQKQQLIAQLSENIQKYDLGLAQIQQQDTRVTAPLVTVTPAPNSSSPTAVPTKAPQASAQPSITPITTSKPQSASQPSAQQDEQDIIQQKQALDEARKAFEDLQKKLEEESKQAQKSQNPPKQKLQQVAPPSVSPAPPEKTGTTFHLFSVQSPVVQSPLPSGEPSVPAQSENSPSPAPAACSSPAIPTDLKYDANTKTASWTVAANATYYNVRLVSPDNNQFNFDNDTNTWYTFPDNAVESAGTYSWWVDGVNDCGTSNASSSFTIN